MGLDFRYLLFFEREACVDALEHLAAMAVASVDETTLVVSDRIVRLPFRSWPDTNDPIVVGEDGASTWNFHTSLYFEPDEEIEAYVDGLRLRSRSASTDAGPAPRDADGRVAIGTVYLSVHRDMAEWPTGAAEDLVLFEFKTPGTTMSVLFERSSSIRRTFVGLLASCRGVYGLLDLEDTGTDLVWLRGVSRNERLPTAEIPLGEIESFVTDPRSIPLDFGAVGLVETANALRHATGSTEVGVHHWLLALLQIDHLPYGFVVEHGGPTATVEELRRRLDHGDTGPLLSIDEVRRQATDQVRRRGGDVVTANDLEIVISDATG